MDGKTWAAFCILLFSCFGCHTESNQDINKPPNILLIVADDLAYTDLGVYGGEIGTPNLDALARDGVLFKNFYTASTCSPTRSMLLTGVDNHLAGFGTMTGDHVGDQLGAPGYETYLNFRVASLAELLQDAGYNTLMTGKWHLGGGDNVIPSARGFDRSFVMIEGEEGISIQWECSPQIILQHTKKMGNPLNCHRGITRQNSSPKRWWIISVIRSIKEARSSATWHLLLRIGPCRHLIHPLQNIQADTIWATMCCLSGGWKK